MLTLKPNKGFVYVATNHKRYITCARYSAISLKEYWPESHITLFTHEEWVNKSDKSIFDNIITNDVPNHVRAKLWALDKTPYDLTCYIDVDTEVMHDDVRFIFDQHDTNSNISLTKARRYAASIDPKFSEGELTDHCGLFIYDNKPETFLFMQKWWELYQKQHNREWNWDTTLYPEFFRTFDMWTYWWLQNKTEYKIKRSFFPEPDARWNFVYIYKQEELMGQPIVIKHTPVPKIL